MATYLVIKNNDGIKKSYECRSTHTANPYLVVNKTNYINLKNVKVTQTVTNTNGYIGKSKSLYSETTITTKGKFYISTSANTILTGIHTSQGTRSSVSMSENYITIATYNNSTFLQGAGNYTKYKLSSYMDFNNNRYFTSTPFETTSGIFSSSGYPMQDFYSMWIEGFDAITFFTSKSSTRKDGFPGRYNGEYKAVTFGYTTPKIGYEYEYIFTTIYNANQFQYMIYSGSWESYYGTSYYGTHTTFCSSSYTDIGYQYNFQSNLYSVIDSNYTYTFLKNIPYTDNFLTITSTLDNLVENTYTTTSIL